MKPSWRYAIRSNPGFTTEREEPLRLLALSVVSLPACCVAELVDRSGDRAPVSPANCGHGDALTLTD